MKTKLQTILLIATGVTALVGFSLSVWAHKPWPQLKPKPHTIIHQPESQSAQAGAFAGFGVRVHPATVAKYQWRLNGQDIQNATNREFFFNHVSVTNVGAYSVYVSWPGTNNSSGTNILSSTAFLSVYSFSGSNNISGTITIPAAQFSKVPEKMKYECPEGTMAAFDRYYEPGAGVNEPGSGSKKLFYFFGPNIATASQTGPFMNWIHNYNLAIDMNTPNNAGTLTGIQAIDDSLPDKQAALKCNSGDISTGAHIELLSLSTAPGPKRDPDPDPNSNKDPDDHRKNDGYRVRIFYKTPGPAAGNIEMRWTYF